MDTIGRPARIFISACAMGKLYEILASYVHYKNVEIPRFKSPGPGKSYVLAIRVPSWVGRLPFPSGQAGNICSVNTHSIYLRCASAPGGKDDVRAGLGIRLGFHFERPGVCDAAKST